MQIDSDFHTQDLIWIIKGLESGDFFTHPIKDQILYLGGIKGKYLGKGEVLWALIPEYLNDDFFGEFKAAFSAAIEDIKS